MTLTVLEITHNPFFVRVFLTHPMGEGTGDGMYFMDGMVGGRGYGKADGRGCTRSPEADGEACGHGCGRADGAGYIIKRWSGTGDGSGLAHGQGILPGTLLTGIGITQCGVDGGVEDLLYG